MYSLLKFSSFILLFVLLTELRFIEAQNCPTWWTGYGDSCYRFRWVNRKTWSDAQQWCQAQTADLVKLETSQERSWIINQTKIIDIHNKLHGEMNWWMGLNDLKKEGTWVWGDNSSADSNVVHWKPGEPNNLGNEDCGGISNGNVLDRRCSTLSKYICERARGVPLPCDAALLWQTFNGHCFKVRQDAQTWYNAVKLCNQEGGSLATINDIMDEVVVYDFAKNNGKPFWIGLQSLQTQANGPVQWTWGNNTYLSNSVTYWNRNQPQLAHNRQNSSCVYVSNSVPNYNAWMAAPCTTRRSFVCKKPEGVCPNGWIAHQKKCFQFNVQFKKSWPDARLYCNAQGSHLIPIYGNEANNFLMGYADELQAAGIDSYWIGLTDNNTDGANFTFSNGEPLGIFRKWMHNPPINTKGRLDCGFIATGDRAGLWRTTASCLVRKAFVCTVPMNTKITPVSTPSPQFTCDRHWRLFQDYCYQFNDTRMNWLSAKGACKSQGGELVKITTNAIEGFINANTHRQEYWIGLNDRNREKRYVWNDETTPSRYFRWNPHEPNNLAGENCVETRGLGWNDKDCSTLIKFICHKTPRNIAIAPQSTLPARTHSTKCGELWEDDPNSDYCYQFNTKALDWEDSRDSCRTQGGDLVNIQTREEGFYLNTKIQALSMFAYWIGANDRSSEGGWRWSDGSPFAYVNWAPGEPNDYRHNEDCGALVARRGSNSAASYKWNDVQCTVRFGYICKKLGITTRPTRPTPSPTPPAGKVFGCPDYWKSNGASCYQFIQQKLNWNDAKSSCLRRGSNLASIANQDEQNYIYSQLRNIKGTGFWIGLNDLITDMSFQWIDGSRVTYTNWANREPNNFHNRKEDCVMMYIHGGKWNDGICASTGLINGFVCKRPKQVMSNTPKPESVGCTLPAVGYGASCYYGVAGATKTWQDAETDCNHRFHGHLATVNDRYTQAFLSSYMLYRDDVFWIGLNDQASRGTYKWVSGWPVSFSYWAASHTGNEIGTCVAMRNNHPRGLWENHNCTEKHHYWCQYDRPNFSTPPTTALNPNAGQCPSGWTNHLSYCYKVYDPKQSQNLKSWMEARDYCQSIGANLASIHSQDEDTFISGTLLSNYHVGFWIGLNDRDNENGYIWIDGSATDFTNWNKGEPNNFKSNEDCVEYSMQTSNWNDNNCYLSNSFICKIPKGAQLLSTAAPPTATSSSLLCGTELNWIYYNGSCYYISQSSDSTKNAFDANAFCNSKSSYLASIHSLDENNLIFSKITKGNLNAYWIGLNDLSTTSYTWIDNTVVDFDYWNPGEPNDAFGGERCVVMVRSGGVWNDDNCNEDMGFICRKTTSAHKQVTPAPTALINAGCNNGFIPMPNSNKCYLFKPNVNLNWTDARDQCRKYGSGYDIASINSAAEQAFLVSNMKGMTNWGLWIGLNNFRHHGHFVWQDNSPFVYQNWAPNEPNGHSENGPSKTNPVTEDCVELYGPGLPYIPRDFIGKWNDFKCSNTLGYICQGYRDKNIAAPPIGGSCTNGYKPYGTGCYKVGSTRVNWHDAQQICSGDGGGNLASILDVFEEAFIYSTFDYANQSVWIGLSYSSQGSYNWVDGWSTLYTHWGRGQPVKRTNGGCVAFVNGHWRDATCNIQRGFVCKQSYVKPPPKTTAGPGTCPTGQLHHNDFCYYGDTFASKTWPGANYMCQKLGMAIVSIHSADEMTFVWKNLVQGVGIPIGFKKRPPSVWIGMNKGLSDGFTWLDNSAVNYFNWSPNEPSDPMNSTQEECVEMYRLSGKWNDKNCFTTNGYICKAPVVKPTTPGLNTQAPINNQKTPIPVYTPNFSPIIPYSTQVPKTTPNPIPIVPNAPSYNGRQTQTQNNNNPNDLSGGAIAAILVSVVFVLVIVGLVVLYMKRRTGNGFSGSTGAGGIDNTLYYEKSNEQVNINAANGQSGAIGEMDA